jgi:hypothetical protein
MRTKGKFTKALGPSIKQIFYGSYPKELKKMSKKKPINDTINPQHYKDHPSGIETITITEHFNFNLGNAIKYCWRADNKNGLEDLKKAQWYINREIARRNKFGDTPYVTTK